MATNCSEYRSPKFGDCKTNNPKIGFTGDRAKLEIRWSPPLLPLPVQASALIPFQNDAQNHLPAHVPVMYMDGGPVLVRLSNLDQSACHTTEGKHKVESEFEIEKPAKFCRKFYDRGQRKESIFSYPNFSEFLLDKNSTEMLFRKL